MLVWCPSRSSIGHDASANYSVAFGSTEKESSIWHHAPKIYQFRGVFPIRTSMKFARASKFLLRKTATCCGRWLRALQPVLLNFRRSKGRSRTAGRSVNLLPTQFRPLRRWGNVWIDLGLKGRKRSANLTTFLSGGVHSMAAPAVSKR